MIVLSEIAVIVSEMSQVAVVDQYVDILYVKVLLGLLVFSVVINFFLYFTVCVDYLSRAEYFRKECERLSWNVRDLQNRRDRHKERSELSKKKLVAIQNILNGNTEV